MSAIYQLSVITPEKQFLSQDADFVIVPGIEGYFGVLSGHAPLVSVLSSGELSVGWGEHPERYAVSGGYAEVLPDRVTILVERAIAKADINIETVQADLAEAEKSLAGLPSSDPERNYWEKRRDYANACLEVSRKQD
ncbi:MAG: ATP synthase F1 subunit epsilon [Magnetococcales bacterium]|nr:ATP synthase F1 subunit epsilon [Magnetococcales bacterium]